jgi:hypothetical protein
MKLVLRLVLSLFVLAIGSSVAAALDQVAANGLMLNAMNQYYDAEKSGAFPVVFSITVFAAVLGGFLVARGGQFSKGMGWSLIVLGAGVGAGTIIYSVKVTPKQQSYVELLRSDPPTFRERQLASLEQTMKNFHRIILVDLSLVVAGAGLAAYGWSKERKVVAGVSIGVMISFLSLVVVEFHNRARAIGYEESVREFRPAIETIRRDVPPL